MHLLKPPPSLTAILAASLDAVIVSDDAGVVVAWNSNAEQIFGYSEAEALNGQVAELIIPVHTRAAHSKGMARYLSSGEVRILGRRVKFSAMHKDGHEFPIELALMITSSLEHKFFVAFIRDLSAEQEAAETIEDLQNEVVQLSRLSAMGTAAAMIAHELNQPLAAATNYLEGCQSLASKIQGPQTSQLATGIAHAQRAIWRAVDVVKGVREIVAKRPVARSKFQLRTLINNSMRLIGSSLPVVPQITIDADAKIVKVNKGQFEQVLLNILKNAIEALHGRSDPSLTCSAKRVGQMVEICIQDNGPGLSVSARENLFSPFGPSKKDGLGIGLSICRSIIEQHGGKVWADSGKTGTAF